MMNQAVVEALYSATYVEDYIDACENLPDDIQRQLSRMRELDATVQGYMRDAEAYMDKLIELQTNDPNGEVSGVSIRLQQLLISAQEAGDEKLQVAQQIQDFVDNKVRQLDLDKKNLDIATDSAESQTSSSTRGEGAGGGGGNSAKQNGTAADRVIKRARRAKHEVFVPSILGPSTLAATRYAAGDEQREREKGAPLEPKSSKKEKESSTKGGKNASASAAEKESKKAEKAASRLSAGSKVKASKASAGAGADGDSNSASATPSKSAHEKVKVAATISSSAGATSSGERSTSAGSASASKSAGSASAADKSKNIQQEGTSAGGIPSDRMATLSMSTAGNSAGAGTSGGNGSASAGNSSSAANAAGPSSSGSAADSSSTPSKQEKESKKKAAAAAAAAAAAEAAAEKKKYKKRKSKQEDSPPNIPIDPDEPTYCLCDQVSYGEMIGCDNDLCPIEWFHFSCVSLSTKPKGKWFCPKCRGDRPNVMKPKGIFLKELEKYNREKEEKN